MGYGMKLKKHSCVSSAVSYRLALRFHVSSDHIDLEFDKIHNLYDLPDLQENAYLLNILKKYLSESGCM